MAEGQSSKDVTRNVGNEGQSGTNAAQNTTGNGSQSGTNAAQNTGNGGQSGTSATQNTGNGGQSGTSAAQNTGNGGQSGTSAAQNTENGGQSGTNAAQNTGNEGQSGTNDAQNTGNGGQSGTNAAQNTGNEGQSGTNAAQNTGNGGQSSTNAAQNTGNGSQSGTNAAQDTGNGGQSGANAAQNTRNGGQSNTNAAQNTENGGQSDTNAAQNVQSNTVAALTYDPAEELASMQYTSCEHRALDKPMGVNKPIEASSTFTVPVAEDMRRMFKNELGPERNYFIYSRHLNPTVMNLSTQMAKIENTEAAYCTSSGMAAISSVLLQLCKSGDHVVASNRLYGGTFALLNNFLPTTCNINTTFVDVNNMENVKTAIQRTTKVIFVESISNPTLTVADIPNLAVIAREKHVKLVVDNTFAPMVLTPVQHGADVVVHSITKFISGGSDIIAGVVCGKKELVNSMISLQNGALMLLGSTMDPKVAFEISQRLPHLGIRMKEHGRRALEFAKRLKGIENIYRIEVIYPGLEDNTQHDLLKSIANQDYGFGGVLCVDMGSEKNANKLMESLQNHSHFGLMAVSLGYFETLMSCPGSSTSSEMNAHDRESVGISQGLVRISIGFTGSLEQRWKQFMQTMRWLEL